MSLFSELKHRHVFRVGIAYVVVAWIIIQLADILALELTPQGIKKADGDNVPI